MCVRERERVDRVLDLVNGEVGLVNQQELAVKTIVLLHLDS